MNAIHPSPIIVINDSVDIPNRMLLLLIRSFVLSSGEEPVEVLLLALRVGEAVLFDLWKGRGGQTMKERKEQGGRRT
jgi:hypothetical protein